MSYPCPHCGIDTALAFPGPADEVVIGGKRWRVIPSGFGYDDGSQSCRLVPVLADEPMSTPIVPTPCSHGIPDGHTRIDGKLFRLERHGDLNRYGLVRVEATDD